MGECRLPSSLYSERYVVIVCGAGGRDCKPILLEPGEVQASALVCTCGGLWVVFIDRSLVLQVAAGRGLPPAPRLRLSGGHYAPLVIAVYRLCTAVEQNLPAAEQKGCLEGCLRSMLDLMVEPGSSGYVTHPGVTTARDYLRRRCHETVTLEELARISCMSRFHLVRAFADHIGLPPHAYQTRLRVERATELLRAGMRPGEVANLTGFADQSHLTRHFRRIIGVTPGEYAQGAQALL